MNPLSETIEALGLTGWWTYLVVFMAASLLMIWRLESLLRHGLEGTALATVVMPYCSGLGNLLLVAIVAARQEPSEQVLVNGLVNNVTNLTLVLSLPVVAWGLDLRGRPGSAASGRATGTRRRNHSADTQHQLNRLSLLLTLAAVLFFTGMTWALGSDGRLDRHDGLTLVGVFLFWQCFQVFDVMKHNVRRRQSFGAPFYVDLGLVLAGAYGIYVSIDWLVAWLAGQKGAFVNSGNLGWLSGWLMVLPNALLAFYYAAKNRGDIAYASQIGDGHICIPLSIGLAALLGPVAVSPFFLNGLIALGVIALGHLLCVVLAGGLPRWSGWVLMAGYGWFLAQGLLRT